MKRLILAGILLGSASAAMANVSELTVTMSTSDCDPISAEDYRETMTILVGKGSEELKLKAAKKALKKGCINLDQLSEIMDHLQSEDSKLAFAKEAYSNCTDQDNFLEIVQEKFESSESVEELNGHITTLK